MNMHVSFKIQLMIINIPAFFRHQCGEEGGDILGFFLNLNNNNNNNFWDCGV